jgi:hypothetical protein
MAAGITIDVPLLSHNLLRVRDRDGTLIAR